MESSNYARAGIQWLPQAKSGKERVKKILGVVGLVLTAVLVFLAVYLPLTYRWSQHTWSDLSIEEIIYHLLMPLEGTGTNMVLGHVVQCLLPAIIVAAAFVAVMILIRKKVSFTGIIKGAVAALCAIIIANTIASFWKNMGVTEYVTNQSNYSSFMDENYVDPGSVNLTFPEKKRNLIYIFLESMENTYADVSVGGAFPVNVIPELTTISLENENFSGGHTVLDGGVPMTGATWTMGAMFAQTSGLPLLISIDKNSMSSQDEFFPGAVTLGDILADQGYNQTLLLGSEAAFGGRELYFETHGNYKMADYNYYIENGTLPADYFVWWGYEDKYLFENAKTELAELYEAGQPFNLTILTVDTHFEDGYICSECEDAFGDDQYSNVFACSSRQVAAFLDWLKEQPYYEDTTVVIGGDHLTMDTDYCNNVPDDYVRTAYFTIINSDTQVAEPKYRKYSTFDSFPTTLAAMGVSIPGDRLGLGTNLYSATPTLLEIYGKESFNEGISAKSELMDNLTAGISTKMVTLTPMNYNSETKTIQVIASDLSASEELETLSAMVWKENDRSDMNTYLGTNRGDGTWIFNIPFSDFGYRSGTYNFSVTAKNNKIADYLLGATTIYMSDAEMEDSEAAVETFTGVRFGDFNYKDGTFDVYVSEQNADQVTSVMLAVWKESDQSDLHWYNAKQGADGVYSATVNAMDYAFDGRPFMVHIYESTVDGNQTLRETKTYKIQ